MTQAGQIGPQLVQPKGPINPVPQDKVGRMLHDHEYDTPKKGKLRVMTVSDSAWAPTGFGSNTKNIASILNGEGHHIGYGGCQNPHHAKWQCPWPLGQEETWATFENLPIMFPGQEKYGKESFPHWVKGFKPDVVLAHLDFQMFQHITDHKTPRFMQLPLFKPDGSKISRKERTDLMNNAYKQVMKGTPWKLGVIIPYDGEPSLPQWRAQLDVIDYGVAMSRYGQQGLKKDFDKDTTYIPHGVDTNLFKPIMNPNYKDTPLKKLIGDAFVVGCVSRNQHRKNIPRLVKGFAQFVKKNNLTPKQVKLILHMDWNDAMGWRFPEFADQYGVGEYLMPPLMDSLDNGEAINEEQMAHLYNCMDMFVLPTGGEGFGIPTLEAMSCGIPVCATNYTTSYELIKCEDAENEEVPMYPLGGDHTDSGPNGRDHLEEEDICERGILIPYKDMWWDTPNRAAPQRAIASENAIAEAIQHYYDNPVKKLEAGKAGRKHAVKYYSWDVIGKKWIDWINNITEELK
jgi:glycosyltransferase involved in cell wall biosynthesis|tara:strand:+ start:580 stop:2121 length:1542 start_codon:yes stop_codon:yes gene_type:complete